MTRSRLCRCKDPVRITTTEGVDVCERCEELLFDGRDELIATLVRAVIKMERQFDALTEAQAGSRRGNGKPVGPLTTAEVCQLLNRGREYVIARAGQLGGRKDGSTKQARWLFDPKRVEAFRRGQA